MYASRLPLRRGGFGWEGGWGIDKKIAAGWWGGVKFGGILVWEGEFCGRNHFLLWFGEKNFTKCRNYLEKVIKIW